MTAQPGASGRVDAWLWAVRILKTRSAAATACRAGHVKVNGERAKPATAVREGATVEVSGLDRPRILVVRRVIAKRVGPAIAAECLEDHSPPPPPVVERVVVAQRDAGAGRPTKRERRAIDRLRGRV